MFPMLLSHMRNADRPRSVPIVRLKEMVRQHINDMPSARRAPVIHPSPFPFLRDKATDCRLGHVDSARYFVADCLFGRPTYKVTDRCSSHRNSPRNSPAARLPADCPIVHLLALHPSSRPGNVTRPLGAKPNGGEDVGAVKFEGYGNGSVRENHTVNGNVHHGSHVTMVGLNPALFGKEPVRLADGKKARFNEAVKRYTGATVPGRISYRQKLGTAFSYCPGTWWLSCYPARLPPKRTGFKPGRVTGFSHVGIMPDDAFGRTGFLGDLSFPPPFHSGTAPYSPQSPSSALNTSLITELHMISVLENSVWCKTPTLLQSELLNIVTWIHKGLGYVPEKSLSARFVCESTKHQQWLLEDRDKQFADQTYPRYIRWATCQAKVQRRRNEAGVTEDPRENPLTRGIVQYDSYMRKSGEQANRSATAATAVLRIASYNFSHHLNVCGRAFRQDERTALRTFRRACGLLEGGRNSNMAAAIGCFSAVCRVNTTNRPRPLTPEDVGAHKQGGKTL
ncbi:hypothetical protein PR048_019983 [Dryococelus australis]|uniref:Uncharacterized protein n=1 Tax=Dryococelus australis TaxID=614101 RepID=A0ABQ9H505_9NEOP|nr:hypothetical protein PR048_019983 [Dryococelus australis]